MTTRISIIGMSILAVALGVGARAEAGPPTDTLREAFSDVNKILADPMGRGPSAASLVGVRRRLNPVFDFRNAASRSLGDEWPARTGVEQSEFVELFADLLERACVSQVASVADMRGGIRIDYLDEVIDGEVAMVWTTIARRGGGEVRFDYAMIRHGEQWLVRDVFIEDVSLMANLRSQFQRIIRDSAYAGLLVRMRAKSGETPPARAAMAIDPILASGNRPGEGGPRPVFEPARPSPLSPNQILQN